MCQGDNYLYLPKLILIITSCHDDVMQNLTRLAGDVKQGLNKFRASIGPLFQEGKPAVRYIQVYDAMKDNGLNNSSDLLANLTQQAELADKNREAATKLLQVGHQEVTKKEESGSKTRDWKAFATQLVTDLVNIFPLNEPAVPAAA